MEGMAGMEILGYEEILSSPYGVARQILSLSLGASLISEYYDGNGKCKEVSTMQDWLELSSVTMLLIKHIEEGKEIYRRVELGNKKRSLGA